ncbi:MAG: hypothetical protein MnENMB40S_21760 [Rhizobiaceae bacterium MnEN-MB40S]|nr:MAG: hypothetical protein MnENMB40S_21760 [Rhizobiaceae bacterium MnEN-MB40S]
MGAIIIVVAVFAASLFLIYPMYKSFAYGLLLTEKEKLNVLKLFIRGNSAFSKISFNTNSGKNLFYLKDDGGARIFVDRDKSENYNELLVASGIKTISDETDDDTEVRTAVVTLDQICQFLTLASEGGHKVRVKLTRKTF